MNESDIPIDIHTGKLQEWLISRRIVPKNIQPYIRDIRNKISSAIKDMPENDELIKLLSGAHINYFHCKQIVEILKQTEKDTKSVFGTYGSQRMKDWQEIIKLYEKENVYIGETAQIYVRNLTYEIPGVKKQITKFDQQSDESLKRIQDLCKTENVLLNEHTALCQQLGIKGENLKDELTNRLKELPKIYSESISILPELKKLSTIELYSEFTKNSNCLPILRHLIEFGNTTVYQYINKKAPITIEENPIVLNIQNNTENNKTSTTNEIDFGIDDSSPDLNSAELIDFGDLNIEEPSNLETGNIDWGESIETIPSNKIEIDFDVPLEEYGIIVEGVGMDGGIAKGEQAYTILDSSNYREKFIDELYELESFLKLRNYELNQLELSNNMMLSLMGGNLSTHDTKSIGKMLTSINSIINKVQNEQTQHLYQLKHSAKYADLLVSKLNQKLVAVEKIKKTQELLKIKSVELKKQKDNLKPILNEMIEQTKVLQMQIENDISKRYKNRPVNLMGGVNTI